MWDTFWIQTFCIPTFCSIATFCIQNVYKSLSKCGIHFYTNKFLEMWDTFLYKYFVYLHFVYIISDVQKVYIINIMHTICIQIS